MGALTLDSEMVSGKQNLFGVRKESLNYNRLEQGGRWDQVSPLTSSETSGSLSYKRARSHP